MNEARTNEHHPFTPAAEDPLHCAICWQYAIWWQHKEPPAMTNETQPGIPEKWRKLYEFITQEYFTAQFIGSANLQIEPIKELIEENARLEAENAALKLAYGLNLELHGCGGENCTEQALLKEANDMLQENYDQKSELATLRAQLLESGRITDEALKQRDEALAKLEEKERECKEHEEKFIDHIQHVSRFLTEMYQIMVDPIEDPDPGMKIAEMCTLLRHAASDNRQALQDQMDRAGNLPANWKEDSSLEKWFPLTAEELQRLRTENAALKRPVSDEEWKFYFENTGDSLRDGIDVLLASRTQEKPQEEPAK